MVARALTCMVVLSGCQPLEDAAQPAPLDAHAFRCMAEPVMVARCAFYACHGSALRPFSVYARNRMRLDPKRLPSGDVLSSELSNNEHAANHQMALGFAYDARIGGSLLLLKPLAARAGGFFHGGGDVFDSKDDPGYLLIQSWLDGATAAEDCVATNDVGR